MNSLTKCEPSRWTDFLSIPDNAVPTRSGGNADLFVGKNIKMTLTLTNDKEIRFRDVVILGILTIQSSNPEDEVNKPKLNVRDIFIPGKLLMDNISLKGRSQTLCTNIDTFRNNLQELILEWLDIQKENATRIGLRSILI